MTLEELLKKYPNGFSIGRDGGIFKVVFAASSLVRVADAHPLPPSPNGGYLVIEATNEKIDDAKK